MADQADSRKLSGWWQAIVVAAFVAAFVAVAGTALAAAQPPSPTGGKAREPAVKVFPPAAVVAAVNGEDITLGDLEKALKKLPAQQRSAFKRRKHEFLDELVARALLLQEARAKKMSETEAYRKALGKRKPNAENKERALISALLQSEVIAKVKVTDADVRAFYEKYKDRLRGRPSFEKAGEMLRPYVKQQKRSEAVEAYVGKLKDKAEIVRNKEWIEAQEKAAADNPLDRALKSGKPALADFSSEGCGPCKMIKPILEKLAGEMKGKVHVLLLNTAEYPSLAMKYRVRVVPTLIFFDGAGKQLFRHEGFMPREKLLAKMKELGMTGK